MRRESNNVTSISIQPFSAHGPLLENPVLIENQTSCKRFVEAVAKAKTEKMEYAPTPLHVRSFRVLARHGKTGKTYYQLDAYGTLWVNGKEAWGGENESLHILLKELCAERIKEELVFLL